MKSISGRPEPGRGGTIGSRFPDPPASAFGGNHTARRAATNGGNSSRSASRHPSSPLPATSTICACSPSGAPPTTSDSSTLRRTHLEIFGGKVGADGRMRSTVAPRRLGASTGTATSKASSNATRRQRPSNRTSMSCGSPTGLGIGTHRVLLATRQPGRSRMDAHRIATLGVRNVISPR